MGERQTEDLKVACSIHALGEYPFAGFFCCFSLLLSCLVDPWSRWHFLASRRVDLRRKSRRCADCPGGATSAANGSRSVKRGKGAPLPLFTERLPLAADVAPPGQSAHRRDFRRRSTRLEAKKCHRDHGSTRQDKRREKQQKNPAKGYSPRAWIEHATFRSSV